MSGLHSVSRVMRLGPQLHRLALKESVEQLSSRTRVIQKKTTARVTERLTVASQPVFPLRLTQKIVPPSSYSLREKVEKEYICPSRLSIHKPSLVILDTSIPSRAPLGCPTTPQRILDIVAPENRPKVISDPASQDAPVKEARNLLKIRRRKMNRHLLKKFRKRMLFTHRKQKLRKRKKKEAKFQAKLNAITKKAADFDAEEYVKQELAEARRGGFYIKIMSSKN